MALSNESFGNGVVVIVSSSRSRSRSPSSGGKMEEWRSNDMVNHQNDEGGDCVRELMDEHDKEEDKVKEVRMILARRNLCTTVNK